MSSSPAGAAAPSLACSPAASVAGCAQPAAAAPTAVTASASPTALSSAPAPSPPASAIASRHLQAYCSGAADSMGFPRVPTVTETDYRVVYVVQNMKIPGVGPVDGDLCLQFHMTGIVLLCLAPCHPILARGLTVAAVYTPADADAIDEAAAAAAAAANGEPQKDETKPGAPVMGKKARAAAAIGAVGGNKLSGKNKKGAPKLLPGTRLCVIECTGGERFTVKAPCKGLLLELNSRILSPSPSGPAASSTPPATNVVPTGRGTLTHPLPPLHGPSLLTLDSLSRGYVAILQVPPPSLAQLVSQLLSKEQYEARVAKRTEAQVQGREEVEEVFLYNAETVEEARERGGNGDRGAKRAHGDE